MWIIKKINFTTAIDLYSQTVFFFFTYILIVI